MPDKPETKYAFAQVKSFEGDELVAVASTETVDRDGEIIAAAAWRGGLPVYRTNPVILATHQHRLADGRSPVIGSAHQIDVADGALEFRMRFAGTPLGAEYAQLYREGHMRAFSVGFVPRDSEKRTVEGRSVRVWTRADLLEISAVPVPANPEALARMRAAGVALSADDAIVKAVAAAVVEAIGAQATAGEGAELKGPDAAAIAAPIVAAVKAELEKFVEQAREDLADTRDEIAALLPALGDAESRRGVDPDAARPRDPDPDGGQTGAEDGLRDASERLAHARRTH